MRGCSRRCRRGGRVSENVRGLWSRQILVLFLDWSCLAGGLVLLNDDGENDALISLGKRKRCNRL